MFENWFTANEQVDPYDLTAFRWLWEHLVGPLFRDTELGQQIGNAVSHVGQAVCILIVCYLCSILMDVLGRHNVGKCMKLMGVVLGIKTIFTV